METTQMLIAIAIAFVLGGALAYIFWRERQKVKRYVRETPPPGQGIDPIQVRLQAYERLILLTERMSLPNLISRTNQPGLSGVETQFLLTQTIKQEFDHNITQQIYVSTEAWDAIRNLREQNIHIINQVASFLPPDFTGSDLNRHLLEMMVQNPKASLHNIVAEVLSFEAKKLM
ncbi:MAG TPA: hypothetical protein VK618_04685 [Flavitalea sp.]|nr:hypothetical protein [Flavitalea sp.]